jgi:hypothetical protein
MNIATNLNLGALGLVRDRDEIDNKCKMVGHVGDFLSRPLD